MPRSYPACDHHIVDRVARRSRLESCLSFVFIYPFRCKLCSRRFKAFRWGVHYDKRRINRRGHRRLKTDFPVTFSWGRKQFGGTVTDIALSGCRLQTDVNLVKNNILELLFQVPGFETGIRVESAQVRGVGTTFAGLSFLRLARNEKKRLRQLLFTLTDVSTGG